ncbi:hypothetical protein SAMN04489832_6239 [Micromonospora cremea]|uniref:Uncharacterized protein n=1 Tax=Micromonospora cremea TaxID=709881 RepID=A0A1N6AVL1_9ACTN|nr:hypothetical protein SAMN04489832_6239 [Micromonospora cremea]
MDELMYEWPAWAVLHSERDGDCLLWRGEYRKGTRTLYFTHPNGERINVRLFLMLDPGDAYVKAYRTSCRRRRCISPLHQEWQFFNSPGVELSGWLDNRPRKGL